MPAPSPTYHVGDRVIVRQWDSMMEEFGSDPYGGIAVHPNKLSFVLNMKPFCGKEFIVDGIFHDKNLLDEPIYFLNYSPDVYVDLNDGDYLCGWFFTSAMLLPATLSNEPQNRIPTPSITFDDLLQGV
jgi:hypothetical protein